ncbi:MAG TPA: serine hydrolase domain-containing protein [Steroidobacteraceae bacterium]|nr:serine hydrolase domain-containing protein [Steroidobacteraceae bacterium]
MLEVKGHCPAAMAALRDILADEQRRGRALGQAVAVVVGGETVAHLWCGHADPGRTREWTPQTLVCLFSASKPLAAACVLKLIERRRIELDAPVSDYWPAFAHHGKHAITVRHALAHLAGVPIAETAPFRAIYDPEDLAQALEAQRPLWAAGEQLCFHSFTYGILCSELVRRVDGRSLPQFFREELAQPHALDLAFALSAPEMHRCADVVLPEDNLLFRMMTDPATTLGRSWQPMPWSELNSSAFRQCGFASIAGHGSAEGLARFYAAFACGGLPSGRSMLNEAVVSEALREQRHQPDAFMGAPVRMGLGFMLHNEVFRFSGPSSFAQPGLGGVAGVGDAHARLGVGITCNHLAGDMETPLLDRVLQIVVQNV